MFWLRIVEKNGGFCQKIWGVWILFLFLLFVKKIIINTKKKKENRLNKIDIFILKFWKIIFFLKLEAWFFFQMKILKKKRAINGKKNVSLIIFHTADKHKCTTLILHQNVIC